MGKVEEFHVSLPGTLAAKARRVTGIGLVFLLAAAPAPPEPALEEVQAAAARVAAGEPAEDASRTVRLRRAHWLPALRAQAQRRDDLRSRLGEFRGYSVREDDTVASNTWSVMASWDLAQLVYAHEESQLALAHVHLARVRREAADRAAELWTQRRRRRAERAAAPDESARREAALELLLITAELDAVTGGLYREHLISEETLLEAGDGR